MSKLEKLITWFLSKPKDLTWDELILILAHYGYNEIPAGKTGGSRRRFSNGDKDIIALHKPHPQPVVKSYVIKQLLLELKQKGKIING
ncbi:MAG: type II toxin-antitoxin system HicA family toxin [Sphingobacteriaceae bacterium]|nr:MAG: type II toxin-antitoxin system HicA family toxin [Sphingobacteriaceae bacterium]